MRFSRLSCCTSAISFFILLIGALTARSSAGQNSSAIIGLGFGTVINTDEGLGFGFRGRVSTPVNADLSLAADLGLSAFFINGRDDSSLLFDPQVSAILTIPGDGAATYFLTGVGAYLSTGGDDGEFNGPTIHVGIGRAKPLNDGTLFYEFDPTFVIKESSVALSLPLRIGIIL